MPRHCRTASTSRADIAGGSQANRCERQEEVAEHSARGEPVPPNNSHDTLYLDNYATINVDELKQLEGVGDDDVRPARLLHANLADPKNVFMKPHRVT